MGCVMHEITPPSTLAENIGQYGFEIGKMADNADQATGIL